MEDIAHEAGKGKSTLYYYYKSKDEIFEAMITDEFSNIIIKANISFEKMLLVCQQVNKIPYVIQTNSKEFDHLGVSFGHTERLGYIQIVFYTR